MPNNRTSFFVRDGFSEIMEESIKIHYNQKNKEPIRRTFNTEELTECVRKLVWKVHGGSIIKNEKSEYYTNKYSRDKWISILENTNGIKVLDTYVTASDANYNISTKVDCVVEISALDDLQVVIYVKSLPSKEYEVIKKCGSRKDVVKIMTDMWLIEIQNGMIIYENRDNLEFMVYRVIPHNGIMNSIKHKFKEFYGFKQRGEIPDRPYKNKDSLECTACEYRKKCWE